MQALDYKCNESMKIRRLGKPGLLKKRFRITWSYKLAWIKDLGDFDNSRGLIEINIGCLNRTETLNECSYDDALFFKFG